MKARENHHERNQPPYVGRMQLAIRAARCMFIHNVGRRAEMGRDETRRRLNHILTRKESRVLPHYHYRMTGRYRQARQTVNFRTIRYALSERRRLAVIRGALLSRFNLTSDKTRMQIEISSCERWMMPVMINGHRDSHGRQDDSESRRWMPSRHTRSGLLTPTRCFAVTSTTDVENSNIARSNDSVISEKHFDVGVWKNQIKIFFMQWLMEVLRI